MESIEFFDSTNRKLAIRLSEITEFGIVCSPVFRPKGGFKNWLRRGYIISSGVVLKNHTSWCSAKVITELKPEFKGKITIKKETLKQLKYTYGGVFEGEKRTINWTYIVKPVK